MADSYVWRSYGGKNGMEKIFAPPPILNGVKIETLIETNSVTTADALFRRCFSILRNTLCTWFVER